MKKILLILLLVPSFVFGQTYYRIYADTTIFGSIGSGKNEVVIKNRTKDSTGGFLSNKGNGVLEFKKLRNKKINDSTYVIVSGTTVLGDTLKIKGSGVSGGGVSQSALNDSITTVRNIRKVDTIYKVTDSIVYKINGVRYSVIDNSGGGGSDSLLFNRTYLDLANEIADSTLKKGVLYKITDRGDRGLFFHSISNYEISKTGQRLMLCPTWYGVGSNSGNNWIGVWHDDASVSVNDLAIWGAFVWKNLTGNIGTAIDDFTLDNTNWVLIPKTSFSNGEYTEKQFDVVYDFQNDWIQWQMDGFSNGVGFAGDVLGYQPCDHSDWHQTLNPISGVNAFANHNLLEGWMNNYGSGEIANNLSKVIKNNHLQGSIGISANKSNRIENNKNTGNIIYNTVFAVVNLPATIGEVEHNSTTAGSSVGFGIDGTMSPFDTLNGDIIGYQFNGTYATDNSVTKLVGVNANGETKMVDKSTFGVETIVELGTITYTDINSASATQDITIPLTTNDFPDSSYCVGLFYKITEQFDGGSDAFGIIQTQSGYVFSVSPASALVNYIDESGVNYVIFATGLNQQLKQGSVATNLPIHFATSNPQDFTAGSVTIYAITKPFPF